MANPVVFNGIDDLKTSVGEEIGVSEWRQVTQDDVDAFAELTGDDQWIHVDPERAKSTPFGGTIVHGYFTLALVPRFSYDLWTVENVELALNYGTNKVRFPSPLPVGSRVRMRVKVQAVDDVPGGAQLVLENVLESEGGDKPVCVAESVVRLYAAG